MTTPELRALSAQTALNDMFRRGHFNVCAIDTIAEMFKVKPAREPYLALRPLHCVNFADMPAELREAIPALIAQCFADAVPDLAFDWPPAKRPSRHPPGALVTVDRHGNEVPDPPARRRLLPWGRR